MMQQHPQSQLANDCTCCAIVALFLSSTRRYESECTEKQVRMLKICSTTEGRSPTLLSLWFVQAKLLRSLQFGAAVPII